MYSKSLVMTVVAITSLAAHAAPILPPNAAVANARSNRGGIVAPRTSQEDARKGVTPPAATNTNSKKVTINGKDNSKVELDVTIVKNSFGDYEASYTYNPENFGAVAAGCTTGECSGTVSDTIFIHQAEVSKLSRLNEEIAKRIGTKETASTETDKKATLTEEEKKAKREAKRLENCTLEDDAEEGEVKDCVKGRYNELLDAYKDAEDSKEKSKAKEALLSFLDENQGRLSDWLAAGGKDAGFAGNILNSMARAKVPFNDLKVFSTTTISQSTTKLELNYQQMVQNALGNAASNPQMAQFQMHIAGNVKTQLMQIQAYGNNSFKELLSTEQTNLFSSRSDAQSQMRGAMNLSELVSQFNNSPVSVSPDLYRARAELNAGCYALKLSSSNDCKVVDLVTGNSVTLLTSQAVAANGATLGTARSDRFDGTGYAPLFTNGQIPAQFMLNSNGQTTVQGLPGAASIPDFTGSTMNTGNAAVAGPGRSGRSG